MLCDVILFLLDEQIPICFLINQFLAPVNAIRTCFSYFPIRLIMRTHLRKIVKFYIYSKKRAKNSDKI